MSSLTLEAWQRKRDQLKAQLAALGDMRPGSLVERYRKCGKPSCHCAPKDARGHGPSYSLTHGVRGKTVTRIIPKGPAVEQARAQIAEYRHFRQLVRQLVEVSEQICEAQLRSGPEEEEKKKRPGRPVGSRRRRGS